MTQAERRPTGRTIWPARSLAWAALAALAIHALAAAAMPWLRMPQPPSSPLARSPFSVPQAPATAASIDAALAGAIAVSTQPDVTAPATPLPKPHAPTRRARRLAFAPTDSRKNDVPSARPIAALDPAATPGPSSERILSDEELDAAAAGPGFAPAGSGSIVGWARSQNTPVPRAPAGLGGRHGTVRLRIGVSAGGNVRFVRVVAPSGDPVLDDAAARAGWQMRFAPCTTMTGPVDCVVIHEIRFD